MVSVVAGDAFEARANRAGRYRRNEVRNRTTIHADLADIEDDETRDMVRHKLKIR